jgi:hypothetical protein
VRVVDGSGSAHGRRSACVGNPGDQSTSAGAMTTLGVEGIEHKVAAVGRCLGIAWSASALQALARRASRAAPCQILPEPRVTPGTQSTARQAPTAPPQVSSRATRHTHGSRPRGQGRSSEPHPVLPRRFSASEAGALSQATPLCRRDRRTHTDTWRIGLRPTRSARWQGPGVVRCRVGVMSVGRQERLVEHRRLPALKPWCRPRPPPGPGACRPGVLWEGATAGRGADSVRRGRWCAGAGCHGLVRVARLPAVCGRGRRAVSGV